MPANIPLHCPYTMARRAPPAPAGYHTWDGKLGCWTPPCQNYICFWFHCCMLLHGRTGYAFRAFFRHRQPSAERRW